MPDPAEILEDTLLCVAHDMRSPLGAARILADMLIVNIRDIPYLPEDTFRKLTMLRESLIKAERIVEDASEISLLERGSMPVHPQIFPLANLVQSCVEKTGHARFHHDQTFDFSSDGPCIVRTDSEKSEAVILRVLEEAMFASTDNGHIVMTQQKSDHCVRLRVDASPVPQSIETIIDERREKASTSMGRLGSRTPGESRYSLVIAAQVMKQLGGKLVCQFSPRFTASIEWPIPKTTF